MSSDLEIAVQYIAFVLQWFLGWLIDCPYVLLIIILTGCGTILTWKFLTQMTAPPILSSPRTSLVLLLMLSMVVMRSYTMNNQLLELESDLANADWKIRQGSLHRIELLNTLESAGLKINKQEGNGDDKKVEEDEVNPLDGCLHVFIDLGSNRGLQIRKLYEPHTFPLAPIQPLYERFFGKPEDRNLQEICSVSFEPNSKHASHLKTLSVAYATCGIKVLVYQAGVGHKDMKTKFAPFNSLLGHEVGHDGSARLIHEDESVKDFTETHFHDDVELEEVEVVRFAKFITNVVAKRKLPVSAQVITPRVVIKADIEGAELKIIPDMLVTGAFGHVDNLHMEWHGEASYRQGREPRMISKLAPAITALAELTQSEGIEHQFEVEEMDDETYTGMLIYKPWGDYSEMPVMTC
eukprot:TRINITY_DN9293_c0_g1_i3.p1 TRINITY_DN9293_c0_g1~~TRINITY_DN9293_c0_g1_i3.p1  ORF type:complete len:408 (+),score=106.02 TRINITY_DN9293_c0_g1_i3:68-1291(+)